MALQFCGQKLKEYQIIFHLHENAIMTFCVLHLIFSLLATLGNLIVIRALWKASSIPDNLKMLFLSLAFSDFGVGLFGQLTLGVTFAVMLQTAANGNFNFDYLCPTVLTVCYALIYLLTCASFLTITAIAVDRLLAVSLHLRYQELVTSKRVIITIVSLWFSSGVATCIFSVIPNHNGILVATIEIVGLLLTTAAYIRVYKTVIHHQNQIQCQLHNQLQNSQEMEVIRQRKSALGTLFVYAVFVACFLPNLCCIMLLAFGRFRVSFLLVNQASAFLVLLNSSLNPIVYCWRYREIREIVKTSVKKLFASESPSGELSSRVALRME